MVLLDQPGHKDQLVLELKDQLVHRVQQGLQDPQQIFLITTISTKKIYI